MGVTGVVTSTETRKEQAPGGRVAPAGPASSLSAPRQHPGTSPPVSSVWPGAVPGDAPPLQPHSHPVSLITGKPRFSLGRSLGPPPTPSAGKTRVGPARGPKPPAGARGVLAHL